MVKSTHFEEFADDDIPRFDRRRFGSRLRMARHARGLTQLEVGAIMGMAQPRVSMYETGHIQMSLRLLTEYVDTLKLDPGIVFPEWLPKSRKMVARVETHA